jgi:hypothetical protein
MLLEHAHGAASRPVRTDSEAQPTWRDFSRHGLGPGLRVTVDSEPPAAVALFIFQVVVGFWFTHIPRASFPSPSGNRDDKHCPPWLGWGHCTVICKDRQIGYSRSTACYTASLRVFFPLLPSVPCFSSTHTVPRPDPSGPTRRLSPHGETFRVTDRDSESNRRRR